ncbi:MAG: hypothetical protein VYE73_04110 [Acidobacteriota bacterium]|nr:hypothetical protein [Acidobacteriota bacterium]
MASDETRDGWTRLGRDRILIREDRLVVVSRADMSDWVVREFRRTAVLHAGVRYCLDHRERRDGAFHYALKRWPDELRDMAGGIIEYDRDYVARRDAYTRALTKARRAEPLLVPLYPLIGLLPGRVKGWTADRYGLSEEKATVLSLYLEIAIVLAATTFLTIRLGAMGFAQGFGLRSGELASIGFGDREGLILLLLAPDLLIRYPKVLRGGAYPYGFWEWLFRWREPEDF